MSVGMYVVLAVFVLTFVIRIPIAYGMIAGSILYFLIEGMDIGLVADNIVSTLYLKYVVMAVPLFIFTAKVMNSGKVTDYMFKFTTGLVGRWRGGLGHVNVVASLIFSGMTGSAVADASGLGAMEIDAMRKEGYDDGFSCAITAASATVGPVFPPSIPMIYYAMYAGVSIGDLFLGGMIPGVFLSLSLMAYIAFVSKRRGYPRGASYTIKQFLRFTLKALPALFAPVILLGGIYSGVMTPTEAGAVAATYALLVSFLVYRTLGLKDLWEILMDTAKTTGVIAVMIASAATLSFIVSSEQIPQMLAQMILGMTTNKYVLLLILNVVFLVLGMFVNVSTIQLVFVPMVLPLVSALGIDLVHFGVVIVLNMMIGLSTPPYGMLLFIVAGVSDTPLEKVIKEIFPMIGVMILVLLVLTYVPDIVLLIPRLAAGG
jgi:tripartite ATP-independent transporter DctM subunit